MKLSKWKLGLIVRPLTDKVRKAAKTSSSLIIKKCFWGSAARAGGRHGDIILSATGEKVDSAHH